MNDHIHPHGRITPGATIVHAKRRTFVGSTTEGKGSFTLPFPVERIFPLFGPVEESKWAPDWSPTWVYPDPKTAEASTPKRGWTFFISAEDGDDTRTWQVAEYDPDQHRVSYQVFYPRKAAYRIDISAKPEGNGTKTDVRYELVGLSEEGNRFVKQRVENFAGEMEEWKALIEYFLKVGKTRPPA